MTLRTVAVIVALLSLTGCEDRETARARNEQRLPPGCKIVDLDYGDLRVAVVCEGRKTNTSVRAWDETSHIMICNDKGLCTQTPVVTHHRVIAAEIGALQ